MPLSPSERHQLPNMGIPRPEEVIIPEDLVNMLRSNDHFQAGRIALMELVRAISVPPITPSDSERYLVGIHVAVEAAELLEQQAATADTNLEMVE